MPMSKGFEERLLPILPDIIRHFGTPFHILDEVGIVEASQRLYGTMQRACPEYHNYFAVKANSNPELLKLLWMLGMGFDCSSEVELILARQAGASGEHIFCTSNNTPASVFAAAGRDGGCVLNLDDIGFIPKVPEPFPELVCFRYNPGPRRQLESVIGNPAKCKYGVPHEDIVEAYRLARERGARRFGLHTMVVSNERDWRCHAETAKMLLGIAGLLEDELGIRCEFINIGGGLGIPYRPDQEPVDLDKLAGDIGNSLLGFAQERIWRPRLCSEYGRWVAGPHGVFVAECINEKHGYEEFRGLDASAMAAIMRPPMYHPNGGFHHISVFGQQTDEPVNCHVVGPACEDSDRFGWDRTLSLHEGQYAIVHDTGAHAPEMVNNYNNWPRAKMLMLRPDFQVKLIDPGDTVKELVARRYRYLQDRQILRIHHPGMPHIEPTDVGS